jgi:hypothetical protein
MAIREHLEALRQARRINNERTQKSGAIYVIDRKESWLTLDKQYLLDQNWISSKDINAINLALQSIYAYPPTYRKEWIDSQHRILIS